MNHLRFLLMGVLLFACQTRAADPADHTPQAVADAIDARMATRWRSQRVTPSNPCLDHEYLRRVCLDLAGVIPTEQAVSDFLGNTVPDKREAVVEQLLKNQTYARYSAVTWSNLLIGRGKDADALVHSRFRDWLYEQFKANQSFDGTVRRILTASGTPLEEPAVVWTLHHETKAENLAGAAARVFLGVQIQCAQCHDHPFEARSQEEFYGLAAFFARTSARRILLTQQVTEATTGDIRLGGMPAAQVIPPRFVDGNTPTARGPRRAQLAAWIVDPDNKQFARAITNRVWARLLGRGLVDPVDDFSANNPAVYPEVLERLADAFIHSGYDMKFLIRTITRTRAYRLSSRPSRNNEDDERYFSKARLRRLNPEQIVGSVVMSTGLASSEKAWQNPIFRILLQVVVNDFTFVFGNMDETTEVSEFRGTIAQALMMMNSKHVTNATKFNVLSPLTRKLRTCPTVNDKIDLLFRTTLARRPTSAELRTFGKYFRGVQREPQQIEVCEDLYWALLNCNEFHFNY